MKRHTHLRAHTLLEQKVCHHSVTLALLQVLSVWTATGQEATEGLSESHCPHHTRDLTHTHKHTHTNFTPSEFLDKRFQSPTTLLLFHLFFYFPDLSPPLLCFPLFRPCPSTSICFASLCLTNVLSPGCPLALPLTQLPSISPLHLFLHPSQPYAIFPFCPCSLAFFLLSSLLQRGCTAVQRQISVLVPVRQRHGKLHAKTQSANADKGGGVRTSVHTKHQTHLNHKMKWLTSAELENIFLPSLF